MILEHKLPTVLTIDEIDRLLDAVDDIKYKAMFATMYSSGMRVSEVIHLHYDDISRTKMQISCPGYKKPDGPLYGPFQAVSGYPYTILV